MNKRPGYSSEMRERAVHLVFLSLRDCRSATINDLGFGIYIVKKKIS